MCSAVEGPAFQMKSTMACWSSVNCLLLIVTLLTVACRARVCQNERGDCDPAIRIGPDVQRVPSGAQRRDELLGARVNAL